MARNVYTLFIFDLDLHDWVLMEEYTNKRRATLAARPIIGEQQVACILPGDGFFKRLSTKAVLDYGATIARPKWTDNLDIVLGDLFAATLREWLTESEFAEVRARNIADPSHADNSVCHSHDFCDANEAMIHAFGVLYERELFANPDDEESDCDTVNRAWAYAAKQHLC